MNASKADRPVVRAVPNKKLESLLEHLDQSNTRLEQRVKRYKLANDRLEASLKGSK